MACSSGFEETMICAPVFVLFEDGVICQVDFDRVAKSSCGRSSEGGDAWVSSGGGLAIMVVSYQV